MAGHTGMIYEWMRNVGVIFLGVLNTFFLANGLVMDCST